MNLYHQPFLFNYENLSLKWLKIQDFNIFVFFSHQVVLNSMHKYQPRIHVIRADKENISMEDLKPEDYETFVFPETQFTAVTAYQNQLVSSFIYTR